MPHRGVRKKESKRNKNEKKKFIWITMNQIKTEKKTQNKLVSLNSIECNTKYNTA